MASNLGSENPLLTQIRKLTEVSRALTYATQIDEVLQIAVTRATDLLRTDKSLLMLLNDDGLLSVKASRGVAPEITERFSEPLDETLLRRLQGMLGGPSERAFLGVPLVVAGEVKGILAVMRSEDAPIGDEEEWLLSALADQTAVALEKARLDEHAEFRERLIGIVGHDLRSPLTAISMGAEYLLKREGLGEREKVVAGRIAGSANRMGQIIDQLLDFTRSRLGGGMTIRRAPVDLQEVCADAIAEMAMAHPARIVRFGTEGDAHGNWDRTRLSQVVSNLMGNAFQYGARDAPVVVSLRNESKRVILEVANQGEVIAADLLPVIFDPFRRGRTPGQPGSGKGGSLGLGLFIVKEIVSAHGGAISVQSSSERGTVFTVQLPRE